jgi:benzoylformate decarboxylase
MTIVNRPKGIHGKMTAERTVREVTYDLLRSLGLTTVFGNPGSTEETFLKNFPDDFTYILGLQEASVMAMGNLIAAYKGNTPSS